MKNPRALSILFSIVSLPVMVSAQSISRTEFLNQLVERHPIFVKESLTAEIVRQEQASYLGAEDTNIYYGVNLNHESPAPALSGPQRITALGIEGGFERVFWSTGGRLTASASAAGVGIKLIPEFDPDGTFPAYHMSNRIDVSYIHPLKRNRGGFLDRFTFELKKFDIDFSEVQASENLEDFLAGAAARYLDWVFVGEQRRIIAERLRLSEAELGRIQRRREANLVDEVDVLRAEDVVRIWQQNQVLADARWRALQAELSVLAQNEEILLLGPDYDLYDTGDLPSLEDAISGLDESIRILRLLGIRIARTGFAGQQFEEVMKPDLSFIARFNTKEFDHRILNAMLMDKPDLTLGLRYSIPIQNRTARSRLEMTCSQAEQLEQQVKQIRLSLVSTLTNLHIQMRELRNVLELNVEQIASAERRTEAELQRYNQGRGNLTFVIQSQDNEQNARLTYATNAASYHNLMLTWDNLLDRIYAGEVAR
ncbi:TolC family protein [Gemmatimonadota bacterium]